MNEMLEKLGQNAKDAETVLRNLSTNDKNKTLEAAAAALVEHTEEILKANALDLGVELPLFRRNLQFLHFLFCVKIPGPHN